MQSTIEYLSALESLLVNHVSGTINTQRGQDGKCASEITPDHSRPVQDTVGNEGTPGEQLYMDRRNLRQNELDNLVVRSMEFSQNFR